MKMLIAFSLRVSDTFISFTWLSSKYKVLLTTLDASADFKTVLTGLVEICHSTD